MAANACTFNVSIHDNLEQTESVDKVKLWLSLKISIVET